MKRFPPPPNASDLNEPSWRHWFYLIADALNGAVDITTSPGILNQAQGTFPTAGMGGELFEGESEEYILTLAPSFTPDPESFIARSSTKTMTSNTSLQALFSGVTGATNGELTVADSTSYFFEMQFTVSSMSGTSGNIGFSIVGAGTATFTSAAWQAVGLDATTLGTAAALGGSFTASAGATGDIVTAETGTAVTVCITGIFRINAGGTIIPSIQLTTAAAAVIGTNSWFRCRSIGSNTVNIKGSWS